MGQLEDLGAALDAAATHLTDTAAAVTGAADRVSTDVAGLHTEIDALKKQLTDVPNAPDLAPFVAKAKMLSDTAASLRQVALAIDPTVAAPPASTGGGLLGGPVASGGTAPQGGTPGPQPVGGKPLYTLDTATSADPAWTKTDLIAPPDKALYTYGPDAPGGPATGDGLGGVWHVYTGDVIQIPAG